MSQTKYIMKIFWQIIYNVIVVPILYLIFYIIALFNSKVRRSIFQRKNLFNSLGKEIKNINTSFPLIWLHASSMGEFEQLKPLIKKLRENFKNINIIVTFFSPSAYENVKKFSGVDIITYLPYDNLSNVKKFFIMLKPKIGIITKHDIWPNFVWNSKRYGTDMFLINGSLPEKSKRLFPIVKSFTKSVVNSLEGIISASEYDSKRFKLLYNNSEKIYSGGDTRYDQVYNRSIESKEQKYISEEILKGKKVFIAGSTWESDEKHLLPALKKLIEEHSDLFCIIVPHEIDELHIKQIKEFFNNNSILFSNISQIKNNRILIVDKIGILAGLYSYGEIAFIGGSFGPGVHSVIEPAIFSLPILFGPKMLNSFEAKLLVKRGAGFIVNDENQIYETLNGFLKNPLERERVGKISSQVVIENLGATDKIIKYIESYIN
jgi:3-deoxy-D-manno-octulosonic-acid transferase